MASFFLEIAENERHLCVQYGHIVVLHKKECLGKVSIDSVQSVLISAEGVTFSKHFFVRMAEERIPVIICGKNYMPLSMTLPYGSHYKSLPVVKAQMVASPVLKKQLWQYVVATKIRNQAFILANHHPHHPVVDVLELLSRKVFSGDSDNKEGQAARIYWPALFGQHFLRDSEEAGINALLNYGYAIVRAACARALCGAGLLPLLGIHHHNAFNAFCLADDIMEPLRPFVDDLVFTCDVSHEAETLTPRHKKAMARIMRTPLPFYGEEHNLSSITMRMAQGLVKSFQDNNPKLLPLPLAQKAH